MFKAGVDIVLNSRFDKYKEDSSFLEKVFHPFELKDKKKMISIFALKEAFMKALGKKINWKDIEVTYDSFGKPILNISDFGEGLKKVDGSASHDGEYTIAFVVIELEE